MYLRLLAPIAAMSVLAVGLPANAAVKRIPYPEVKVEVIAAYQPDAAFEVMRKALADAVAKRDAQALFGLLGPTFVWTLQGGSTDQFDLGRDALHNFKVLFGFRPFGTDADGPVDNGPYWDALAGFAEDPTFYQAVEAGNLVCGPIAANLVNEAVYEQARKKIEPPDEQADWYFTLAPTPATKTPGDAGAPVARLGTVAFPVLGTSPPAQEGKPAVQPTHLEVLLPSGKPGWIPASAARPLASERLCYAKTPAGDWKIAAYDQIE